MTGIENNRASNHVPTARTLFVRLAVVAVLVLCSTISLCVWNAWGSTIAVSLSATNVGILIAVWMLINKLSARSTEVLTAIGILLAAGGYFYSLPSAFDPVSRVVFATDQMFTLNTDAESCKFDPLSSTLTCPVAITPK